MSKKFNPARAPNKRTLTKVGAVLAAAMLGAGAFSLIDTAHATDYWTLQGSSDWQTVLEDGNPVTTTTDPDADRPADDLPEGETIPVIEGEVKTESEYRWEKQGDVVIPNLMDHSITTETPSVDPPGDSAYSLPAGALNETEWARTGDVTKVDHPDGLREPSTTEIRRYSFGGPQREAAPGVNDPAWQSPQTDLGNHGRDRVSADGELVRGSAFWHGHRDVIDNDGQWIIYTTSEEGLGNWFKLSVEEVPGSIVQVDSSLWTRTYQLQPASYQVWVMQVRTNTYTYKAPGAAGIWVLQEWTGGPRATMPDFDADGWHTPAGRVGKDADMAEGQVEGVPFHGQGRGSWKRWVRIDADAWNNSRPNARVIVVLTQDPGY